MGHERKQRPCQDKRRRSVRGVKRKVVFFRRKLRNSTADVAITISQGDRKGQRIPKNPKKRNKTKYGTQKKGIMKTCLGKKWSRQKEYPPKGSTMGRAKKEKIC